MKIVGANTVPFPVDRVWDAILDPNVLVATIPGCERLEATGEHQYAMTVTAGVAAIKGSYSGTCSLADLKEAESLTMRLQGAGAPGTIGATVDVAFDDLGAEGTRIVYEADAVVGGMIGGVGQRMLTSVSKRMAAEFFDNLARAIAAPVAEAAAPAPDAVYSRPTVATGSTTGSGDFVKGIAVGAGLVLLGVLAGSVLGRRR
jgi:hypothetical protein